MVSQTNYKNFKFSLCDKIFFRKDKVKLVHTSVKDFQCLLSEKFSRKSNLRCHMMTHIKVKTYKLIFAKKILIKVI